MCLRFGRRVLGVIVSMAVAGLLLAQFSSDAPAIAYAQTAAACPGLHRDVGLPLTDLGSANYRRIDGQMTEFTGGLYPDGSNVRPPVHEAAGQALATRIVPRGPDGKEDSTNGRIVLISLGMSNTQSEFQNLMDRTHRNPEVNPQLVLVNGALGGQTADRWVDSNARPWKEAELRLAQQGVTPLQVQAAWVKQTLTRGGPFPEKALELQADLQAIVHNLHDIYPNLQLVFLSSRTRSYLYDRGLSPEPAAFETGFSVKWLIQAQIEGDPALNFDPEIGPLVAPFLTWGPYLWIDGQNPRSDGMTWTAQDLAEDCTHPSPEGNDKVGEMLLAFFLNDTLAARWFGAAGSGSLAAAVTTPTHPAVELAPAKPTVAPPPPEPAELAPSPSVAAIGPPVSGAPSSAWTDGRVQIALLAGGVILGLYVLLVVVRRRGD
jgi:hypothetical protein